MQYINPFSLLAIKPGGYGPSTDTYRRAKRKILAEIKLEGFVNVEGVDVDHSSALRVFDELDSDELRHYHAEVYRWESLRLFLHHGDAGVFDEFTAQSTQTDGFWSYLEPAFAVQFERVLTEAVQKLDITRVKSMMAFGFKFSSARFDLAYRGTRSYFSKILETLEDKHETLLQTQSIEAILPRGVVLQLPSKVYANPFNSFGISSMSRLLATLIRHKEIVALNALPDEFSVLRNRIAGRLRHISIDIANNLGNPVIASAILQRAAKIANDASSRASFRKDVRTLRANVIQNCLFQLKEQLQRVIVETKNQTISSAADAEKIVKKVFVPRHLNRVSSKRLDTMIVAVTNLVNQIAWQVVVSFCDGPVSKRLIELCLEIRLSDPEVTKALATKLIGERFQIEVSVGRLLAAVGRAKPSDSKPRRHPPISSPRYSRPAPASATANRRESSNENRPATGPVLFSTYLQSEGNETQGRELGAIIGLTLFIIALGGGLLYIFAYAAFFPIEQLQANVHANTVVAGRAHNADTRRSPVGQMATPSPSSTPEVSRPSNGAVLSGSRRREGLGSLTVDNQGGDEAIAKLTNTATGKTYREVYIRSGEVVTIKGIRIGTYRLLFSTGRDYAPSIRKFLNNAKYEKFDDLLSFTENRDSYGITAQAFRVTLTRVVGGNATTSTVNESEFDGN